MKKKKDDFDETDIWNALPKDVQDTLLKAADETFATSADEFVNEIFVGQCPQCGSRATKDCEEVDEIEDITVGLCTECGYMWCTECGRTVVKGAECEHWDICDKCTVKKDEFGDCGRMTWECEKVSLFEESDEDETSYECAWCNKAIRPDSEVFAVGAKARKGMNLKKFEGLTIPLELQHCSKSVPATITMRGSGAKKDGNDILFMVCSKKCGEALRKALLKEKFTVVGGTA